VDIRVAQLFAVCAQVVWKLHRCSANFNMLDNIYEVKEEDSLYKKCFYHLHTYMLFHSIAAVPKLLFLNESLVDLSRPNNSLSTLVQIGVTGY